jgi:Toastrack DUF4097
VKKSSLFVLPILLVLAACRSAGGTETQTINLPYPQADVVTLNLSNSAGQVAISAADSAGVSGSLTTNVGAWQAETSTSGSTITIAQGSTAADVIPDAKLDWNVQLGRGTPLILNHTNTSANTTLNLGGLALTQLNVTATTGDYTLRYDTPSPAADGGSATITLGNGSLGAAGLGSSHLDNLAVTTTGGDVRLNFGGALTTDMAVRINTQSGDILLTIPHDTPAQVTYRAAGGSVLEVDPQYTKTNDITYTVGDSTQTPRLTIEIRTVVGDLRLAGA